MRRHFPLDFDDPFGSRPDEKPPEGWEDGFWEEVRKRIVAQRDNPGHDRLPAPPQRGARIAHLAMIVLAAATLIALFENRPSPAVSDPAPLGSTLIRVDGSGKPDVAVEWARIDGKRSGYVVLRSIDPQVSYVLIDRRYSLD